MCIPSRLFPRPLPDTPTQLISYKDIVSTSLRRSDVTQACPTLCHRISLCQCGLSYSVSSLLCTVVRMSFEPECHPLTVLLVLTMRSFLQRQAQFAQFLSSNKALSASRYFRLMALACVEMMCTVPLSITFTVLNLKAQPFDPWVSWDDTHYNFSRVLLVPSVIWRQSKLVEVSVECGRWSPLFCAFVFFAFFGFAEESRKNYTKALTPLLAACRLVEKDGGSLSTTSTISSKYVRLSLILIVVQSNLSFLGFVNLPFPPMQSPLEPLCPYILLPHRDISHQTLFLRLPLLMRSIFCLCRR